MAPVRLNVYDLTTQLNAWTYWCGFGVFHAGVEVHGVEFAFGGHDYDVSGIFATRPREAPGADFRMSLPMGNTALDASQVQSLISQMGSTRYRGNRYHLLQLNCNHFASEMCEQLTGAAAPGWINRLAGLAVMLHCLLPAAWVPPLQTPSAVPDLTGAGGVGTPGTLARPGKRRAAVRDISRQKLLDGPLSDEDLAASGVTITQAAPRA